MIFCHHSRSFSHISSGRITFLSKGIDEETYIFYMVRVRWIYEMLNVYLSELFIEIWKNPYEDRWHRNLKEMEKSIPVMLKRRWIIISYHHPPIINIIIIISRKPREEKREGKKRRKKRKRSFLLVTWLVTHAKGERERENEKNMKGEKKERSVCGNEQKWK